MKYIFATLLSFLLISQLEAQVNGDPGADSTYLSSAEIHACKDKTALTDIVATSLRLRHEARFV
jgi:hypothetical protein